MAETCYRHPDRETGVSCSSCGRPICPDCMTPTPVGMRCPECMRAADQGGAGGRRRRQSASARSPATFVLIALNVVAYLIEIAAGGGGLEIPVGDTSSSTTSACSGRLGRRRRVVPAGHRRLPPRQPDPHRLQHVAALHPRAAAGAGAGHAALRRPLLRLAARRLVRCPAARPQRPHRRRLGGGLRSRRRDLRDRPRSRDGRARRRDRLPDRDQPGLHLRRPATSASAATSAASSAASICALAIVAGERGMLGPQPPARRSSP